MSSTVLVTAATGKTGRRLVPQLLERGVGVRAASRHPMPANGGIEPVRFDWLDERTYQAALDGVDAAYIVSAHLSEDVTDPTVHVGDFVDRAVKAGVRRLVLLSSFGVDRIEATDPLRRLELLVEESGVSATILRPAAFMQNFSEHHWAGLAETIRQHGEIALPGGEHPVSYVSCHDIAAVAAAALTEDGHDGHGYTLTGPAAITLLEVAEHITAAIGRQVRYVDTGPEVLRDSLIAAGASASFADYASQLYVAATTSGAMAAVTADITAVTGRAATTFAEYAAGAADAWRR